MPGQGTPIIVGGGISLGSPAVVGNFLKLTSTTPSAAATSARLIERTNSVEILGDGATSTAIGNTCDVNSANNIGIGNNIAIASAVQTKAMAIGQDIALGAAGGNNAIAIGSTTFTAGSIGSSATLIGYNISVTASSDSTCVGQGITINGSGNVVVGSNASSSSSSNVVIGASAGAAGNQSIIVGQGSTGTGTTAGIILLGANINLANLSNYIVIGNGASATGVAAGTIILGHNNNGGTGFSSALLHGGSDTHTAATAVPAWTNRWKNANGTDVAAGDVTFVGPRATGNATAGAFVFQTSPAGASGTTLQTATTRFRIEPTGNLAYTAAGVTPTYGGGVGVFFLANAGTNPSSNPTGGGILYVNAGALTYRGSGGTVTVIAPA